MLVDETPLAERSDVEPVALQRCEKSAGVAEARQQQQRAAARTQMLAQAGGEALRDIAGAPGALTLIAWLTAQERRIEQDQVEALAGERREQVALAHLEPRLHLIEQRVDARAAHRGGIQVDCQ